MEAASEPLEGSVRQKAAIVSPVGQKIPLHWAHCGYDGHFSAPLKLPLNTSGYFQFLPIPLPAPCHAFPKSPSTNMRNFVVA